MSFLAEALAKIGLGLVDRALRSMRDGKRVYLHELSPKRSVELADRFRDVATGLREHAYRGHVAGLRQPPDRGE